MAVSLLTGSCSQLASRRKKRRRSVAIVSSRDFRSLLEFSRSILDARREKRVYIYIHRRYIAGRLIRIPAGCGDKSPPSKFARILAFALLVFASRTFEKTSASALSLSISRSSSSIPCSDANSQAEQLFPLVGDGFAEKESRQISLSLSLHCFCFLYSSILAIHVRSYI